MKMLTHPIRHEASRAGHIGFHRARRPRRAGRRGVMLVLLVILLAGFLVASSLSVGIARSQLASTELADATDAASKAAALTWGTTMDADRAVAHGKLIASLNSVDGKPLTLRTEDFRFGHTQPRPDGKFRLIESDLPINSVVVSGHHQLRSVDEFIAGWRWRRSDAATLLTAVAAERLVDRELVVVIDQTALRSRQMEAEKAIGTLVTILDETPTRETLTLVPWGSAVDLAAAESESAPMLPPGVRRPVGVPPADLPGAMKWAAGQLPAREAFERTDRWMIVIMATSPEQPGQITDAVTTLAGEGWTLSAVSIGTASDPRLMRRISEHGRGRYFHAGSATELRAVSRELAIALPRMKTQ